MAAPLVNAFRCSKAIYDALPAGVAPHDVGFLSSDGTTEFFVPGGQVSAMELGLSLAEDLERGRFSLHEEDGMAVVTVRQQDLEREDW